MLVVRGSWERLCKYIGPWDDAFTFSVPRTVRIRDWRLGCTLIAAQVAIGIYVVLYVLVLQQAYLSQASLVGSVRLQLRSPAPAFRWAKAPYCLGTTPADFAASATGYQVLPGSRFSYNGAVFSQLPCRFADSFNVLPLTEPSALFLPTEARLTRQTALPGAAACASLNTTGCATFTPAENKYNAGVTERTLLADAEFFTLRIDHNVAAPAASIAKNAQALAGRLFSTSGSTVDPCAPYRSRPGGAACPDYIAVGAAGKIDTVSVATLLAAAGVPSLDAPSAENRSVSLREGGLVLLVDIQYTNSFLARGGIPGTGSFNSGIIEYTLRVSALTEADFKIEEALPLEGPLAEGSRAFFNRHGIRILFSQSGFLGREDLQAFIVNAVTALGLLSLAIMLVEAFAFKCWKLGPLYQLRPLAPHPPQGYFCALSLSLTHAPSPAHPPPPPPCTFTSLIISKLAGSSRSAPRPRSLSFCARAERKCLQWWTRCAKTRIT